MESNYNIKHVLDKQGTEYKFVGKISKHIFIHFTEARRLEKNIN